MKRERWGYERERVHPALPKAAKRRGRCGPNAVSHRPNPHLVAGEHRERHLLAAVGGDSSQDGLGRSGPKGWRLLLRRLLTLVGGRRERGIHGRGAGLGRGGRGGGGGAGAGGGEAWVRLVGGVGGRGRRGGHAVVLWLARIHAPQAALLLAAGDRERLITLFLQDRGHFSHCVPFLSPGTFVQGLGFLPLLLGGNKSAVKESVCFCDMC